MGIDYRLLSFGVRATREDADQQHEQKILNIDCRKQVLRVIKKEVVLETIHFNHIRGFEANADESSFTLHFSNGDPSHALRLESSIDRDDAIHALQLARDKNTNDLAKDLKIIHEGSFKKKGKSKFSWADRWCICVRGRLLVFRNQKAEFPLNAISMAETIPQASQHDLTISLSTIYRDYVFKFDGRSKQQWQEVMEGEARWAIRRANKRKQKRERAQQMSTTPVAGGETTRSGYTGEAVDENFLTPGSSQAAILHESTADENHAIREMRERHKENLGKGQRRAGASSEPYRLQHTYVHHGDDSKDTSYSQEALGYHNIRIYEADKPPPPEAPKVDMSRPFERLGDQFDGMNKETLRPVKKKEKPKKRKKKNDPLAFEAPLIEDEAMVFSWGLGHNFQLGGGFTTARDIPEMEKRLTDKRFRHVACAKGGTAAFGITDENKVFTWGEGELGLGESRKSSPSPYLLAPLRQLKIMAIAASKDHALALASSHHVFGWGNPRLTGHSKGMYTPKVLPWLNDKQIVGISCHQNHSAAFSKQGELYTWGKRGSWLALRGNAHQNAPGCAASCDFGRVAIPGQERVKGVSCGLQHTAVFTDAGTLLTFGVGKNGRLGHGDTRDVSTPKVVASMNGIHVASVSCGVDHTLILTDLGQVFGCGCAADCKLGHGTTQDELHPRVIVCLMDAFICRVLACDRRSFAVSRSGCVVHWGHNVASKKTTQYPMVLEYMRGYRVYEVDGGPGFMFAIAARAKSAVAKPVVYDPTDPLPHELQERLSHILGTQGLGHQLPGQPTAGGLSTDQMAMRRQMLEEQQRRELDPELREMRELAKFSQKGFYDDGRKNERGGLSQNDMVNLLYGKVNSTHASEYADLPMPPSLPPQASHGTIRGGPVDMLAQQVEIVDLDADLPPPPPPPPMDDLGPPPPVPHGFAPPAPSHSLPPLPISANGRAPTKGAFSYLPPSGHTTAPRSSPPPPTTTSGGTAFRLTVAIEGSGAIGFLECEPTSHLSDVRTLIAEELDGVPSRYAFLRDGVPVGSRQELRRAARRFAPTVYLRPL